MQLSEQCHCSDEWKTVQAACSSMRGLECVFSGRSGQMRLVSLKIAMVLMCTAHYEDKYKCLHHFYCSSCNDFILYLFPSVLIQSFGWHSPQSFSGRPMEDQAYIGVISGEIVSSQFNGHFSKWTWVCREQNVSILELLELRMMELVSVDNCRYSTCKAPVKWSPPANQHPVFYRPDAVPVTQPTTS